MNTQRKVSYNIIMDQVLRHVYYKMGQLATHEKVITDCLYEPIGPIHFLDAMEALRNVGKLSGGVKFLDLGAGLGNVISLLRSYVHHFNLEIFADIKGVEKDPRLVDMGREIVGDALILGDMMRIELKGYNILHFFNALAYNREAHNKFMQRLIDETTENQILMLAVSDTKMLVDTQRFEILQPPAPLVGEGTEKSLLLRQDYYHILIRK